MTDTQIIQEGSEDLDREHGEDGLQEQARREAEKAGDDEPEEDRERPPTTQPFTNPD